MPGRTVRLGGYFLRRGRTRPFVVFAKPVPALAAALVLSACTFSDSLLNAPVYSAWTPPAPIERTVVFATDREADQRSEFDPFHYGLHWDAALHCGKATLATSQSDPQFVSDGRPSTFLCDSDMGGFAQELAGSGAAGCKRALLFVHGYNQTFRSAVLRAGQIAADTQYPCAVGTFSWSSEGKFDRYAADIERSAYAVPELITLLRATSKAGLTMDIVAHSMGTHVVLSALSALARSCAQTGTPLAGELVLAAPDVSAEHDNDDFLHLLSKSQPCMRHATVYASDNDMVLIASETIHGGIPRAGRVPGNDLQYPACNALPADIVDASTAPGDKLGHGYFALSYEMLDDIMWTLGGYSPARRTAADLPGGPTLVREADVPVSCTPDEARMAERFVLKVEPDRRPGETTRLLRRMIPLVIPIQ